MTSILTDQCHLKKYMCKTNVHVTTGAFICSEFFYILADLARQTQLIAITLSSVFASVSLCVCVQDRVITHMLPVWHMYADTSPYMHIKHWAYMIHMPNLVDIFVSGTYLAITGEVKTAVGCVLGYIYPM